MACFRPAIPEADAMRIETPDVSFLMLCEDGMGDDVLGSNCTPLASGKPSTILSTYWRRGSDSRTLWQTMDSSCYFVRHSE